MAYESFLRIDGVLGDSVVAENAGWIELETFGWGVSMSSTHAATGGGSGRPTFTDVTITKRMDRASVPLMVACASGEHFPTATIQLNRSGEQSTRLVEYRLADLRITSYHTTSDAGGQTPLETVSFTFSQLVAQYYAVAADGSVAEAIAGGWDLRQNSRI